MITYDKNRSTLVDLSMPIGTKKLTIGERLKEERVRLGLTQPAIAELTSVSKNTQINYEKDFRSPDATYLAAIAGLGADVLYIVTGQRTPQAEGALSVREQKVLYTFRELSEEDQKSLQRLSIALKESPAKYDTGNEGNGAS